MINLLRKLFIKNYQQINDPKVREKHGILASVGGIIINLILFGFKITIGIISLSMSIISDAINNLTDLFSCFVNLFGFKIASKPADEKHPYGHERVEYIAGMIISFIIIAVAIVLGYSSIMKLINHEDAPTYDIYAFIILAGAIVFKILLGLFYYGLGKAINSESLKASMKDSFNDVICTSGVLIAAIITRFVSGLWWLDPSISLCIALFILYSGIKSTIETASPLIGLTPDSQFVQNIVKDIVSYEGVLGIHDLICHSYGHTKIFVSVHVEIDGYENMMVAHDLIDNIESNISKKYGISLTIHMDPVDTKNVLLPELKTKISQIVHQIDKTLTIHDLRVVSGPTHTNVLFDVLVSPNLKISDDKLIQNIKTQVENLDSTYNAVIKIDRNYNN